MKTRIHKRLLAGILSLALLCTLGTTTALAAGEAADSSNAPLPITMSTQAIGSDAQTPWGNPLAVNQETKTATTKIMYGSQEWLVIGYDGNGVGSDTGTMTLLAKDTPLVYIAFDEDDLSNAYKGSDLEIAVNAKLSSFDTKETSAMQERTLPGGSTSTAQGGMYGEDVTAKLWPLDVAEAEALGGGVGADSITGTAYPWLLRSPGSSPYWIAFVNASGEIVAFGNPLTFPISMRPAFQLKLSSVLFSSAATGGKSGNVGEFADLKATDNTLKLTILDETNLMLGTVSAIKIGNQATLTYTGATEGKALSAIFTDSTGAVQYAKLVDSIPAGGSGTATATLPEGFDIDTMPLTVFVEQISGDNKTDYASTPKAVSVTLPSSDAALVSVAGAAITAGSEAGAVSAPKTAAITVVNGKTSLAVADIAVSAKATAHLYSDAGFSTGEDAPTSLAEGENHVYIKVTAEDTTALYYDVAVTRAAPPSTGGSGSNTPTPPPAITTTPPTAENTAPIVNVETQVEVKVDASGKATANVPEKAVTDAIQAAQEAVKTSGNAETGVTVTVKVNTDKAATDLGATLNQNTVKALVTAGVTTLHIESGSASVALDLSTLQQLQTLGGDLQLRITQTDPATLSAQTKALVGTRPVFSLALTSGAQSVTNFDGTVALSLPYAPVAGEDPNGLIGVYITDGGSVRFLSTSRYNETTKALEIATDHFSTYAIGYQAAAAKFTDLAGHWAKGDMFFAVDRGLLNGTTATTFSPDASMTRGMFVTVLGRLAQADVSGCKQSGFPDVKADAYYMGYVEWAFKNGIVNGGTDGKFSPDAPITREQMAVILTNYTKAIGFAPPQVQAEKPFADSAEISAYAKDAVTQMQTAGVLAGKTGNRFDPKGTATRAEVSAVLLRFVELTEAAKG